MPFSRFGTGQRNEVGFAPVVQLPVPMGLGPILQHPFQPRFGEAPLGPIYGALHYIDGLGYLGSAPPVVCLQKNPRPDDHPSRAFPRPVPMLELFPLFQAHPDAILYPDHIATPSTLSIVRVAP